MSQSEHGGAAKELLTAAFLCGMLSLLAGRGATAGTRQQVSGRAGCPVVIEGEARAGESFRAPVGSGLELVLDPVPHGWILRVLPDRGPRPAEDFAELATPPFRSINPLLLTTDFGMRAQDVVGWNPRSFQFLRSRADLPAAERAFAGVVGTPHPSAAAEAAVVAAVGQAAEGRFEILDARLVPGIADQTAAAALVATHFPTTAHTIVSLQGGPLGRVEWLRFRATLGAVSPQRPGERCR